MNWGVWFPGSVADHWYYAPLAFVVDMVLGDPTLPWRHPVCLIGRGLDCLEHLWRGLARKCPAHGNAVLTLGGFLTLGLMGGGTAIAVWLLAQLPLVGPLFVFYFAWAGLAMGCLLKTGNIALEAVEMADLATARTRVSWLVTRDTSAMQRPMLRKTLADTLSENFTDAFMAPMFWLVFTGVPGLWFYKVVSTMDSQWGYLTPRWRWLGCAGAKGDDVLAYLPARLAPVALCGAHKLAQFLGWVRWHGHWPGLRTIAQEAAIMPSPNSGWPMATCAWLCAGRMAGPAIYFGEVQEKAFMGPPHAPPWTGDQLRGLCKLLRLGAWCGAATLIAIGVAIALFF